MKIADYSLSMQSRHDWSQQSSVKETLAIRVELPAPANLQPASSQVTLSAAAQRQQPGETAAIDASASSVKNDPRFLLIIAMVEMMTGHKVRIFNPGELSAIAPVDLPDLAAAAPATGKQPASPPRSGYSLDYEKVSPPAMARK